MSEELKPITYGVRDDGMVDGRVIETHYLTCCGVAYSEEMDAIVVLSEDGAINVETRIPAETVLKVIEERLQRTRPAPAVQVPGGMVLVSERIARLAISNLDPEDCRGAAEAVSGLSAAIHGDSVRVLAAATAPAPSAEAVRVPEGMVPVPVRATDDMVLAFDRIFSQPTSHYTLRQKFDIAYADMLAAAPAPATVATEAVAQGGGVDAEAAGQAVRDFFADLDEGDGVINFDYCSGDDIDALVAVVSRALLSASPAGVGGVKVSNPEATRQYYYHNDYCPARKSDDPGCICWRDEGTGPFPDGTDIVKLTWRDKPLPAAPAIAKQGETPVLTEAQMWDDIAKQEGE